jgi:hypothetical protein
VKARGAAEVVELRNLVQRLCSSGDTCPSLRGQSSCDYVHRGDLGAHLPVWVRETALTFMGAHPCADGTVKKADEASVCYGPGMGWKKGLTRLVARWLDEPEAVVAEAPPVPGPHPEADSSGAPRGVKRGDLLELRDLVPRICIRGVHCRYLLKGVCYAAIHHPQRATVPVRAPWVADELRRLMDTHSYRHLTPAADERGGVSPWSARGRRA